MPLALMVRATGASSNSASAVSSAAASMAPPPARISGRLALASNSVMRDTALGEAPARSMLTGRLLSSSSASSTNTSNGISMCTGRGRPAWNSAKARASTTGNSDADIRVWENAATPAHSAPWFGSSCSLPRPPPNWLRDCTLEITSIGIESA
ncbi:hypothetical protein D3C84_809420 [compost metagenome]